MTIDSEDDALKIVQAEDGRIGISLFAQIIPHGLSSDVTTMSAGTYFLSSTSDYVFELEIPGHKGFQVKTTKPIDYKYLPEALQFGNSEDLIIKWDGNTEGLYTPSLDTLDIYKVSDVSLTKEDLRYGLYCGLSTPPNREVFVDPSEFGFFDGGLISATGAVTIAPTEIYTSGGKHYEQGIYFLKDADGGFVSYVRVPHVTNKMDEKYLPTSVESIVIRSSTEGSTKKFRITVDDSGTISATEVI